MSQKYAPGSSVEAQQSQRLDKWLWYTRVVKSRTLAGHLIEGGKTRINKTRVSKPSQVVRAGDVVTATVAKKVRILKVVALGKRRGPAAEAQGLYEDLTPLEDTRTSLAGARGTGNIGRQVPSVFAREAGAGRPTKRDRRLIDRLKGTARGD